MNDKFSITSQVELTRRSLMQGAASMAGLAAFGGWGIADVAEGKDMPLVSAYGVITAKPEDWSPMENKLGVQVKLAGSGEDAAQFLRNIMGADLGKEVDIFIHEAGPAEILGPRGYIAHLEEDRPELTLWKRTSDDWKRSRIVRDSDGNQWGVPAMGNADSFGYFPEKLGLDPDGDEELSWSLMFEDERTRGKVGYCKFYTYSMGIAALYLQATGGAEFGDFADLTPDEAKTVANFLIERKRAGQFRTFFHGFDEQVQLLTNNEVVVENCWEPAVNKANRKLGPGVTRYAYTKEGYYKWGHGAMVASQAMDRDVHSIYKVLNYFLSGQYHALQARDRGYIGPNMDLGLQYAEENDWPEEEIELVKSAKIKGERKFKKPYVSITTPKNATAMEEQWERFLNA